MILFIICNYDSPHWGVNISAKCDSSSWCNAHSTVKGIQNENLEKFVTRRKTNCHINSENMGRTKFGILGTRLITNQILGTDFPAESALQKFVIIPSICNF